ncbi:uncharacterized protein LOC131667013 [Phymastichus coffea]|uniref:uncharacterized protein LOC131667013 n=1 Tax=Phymastichus coffea TaxID=108790 RepID=UPI00273C7EE1|nr:uncharacterized protein LOC131667013 [Phymastichus coffea]
MEEFDVLDATGTKNLESYSTCDSLYTNEEIEISRFNPNWDPFNNNSQADKLSSFQFIPTARRKDALRQNVSIKKYPCSNCSSVYNRQDNLRQHMKYVCNQRPRFKCPYCDYVAKWTFSVYGHVRNKHCDMKVGYEHVEKPGTVILLENR